MTIRQIPRGVWMLGLVSLCMDLSSEMINSLLPVFLVTGLGASAVTLGLIEGIAEGTASFAKVFAGVISDRSGRRKPLVVCGYGLAALTKPLFPLAQSATWVLLARFVDRIGKGIRGAPRDALVADLTPPVVRGAAYGLRQTLDTAGALLGPLAALGLMAAFADQIRPVFWVATIPALLAVLVLVLLVHEPAEHAAPADRRAIPRWDELRQLGRSFWFVIVIAATFSLARFSEGFLILRAENVGLSLGWIPLALAVMNATYVATAYPFGKLADRLDRAWLLAGGLAVLIASDAMLALAANLTIALLGIATWGVHMGMTQGLLSAMVADSAPKSVRGSAFGIYYCVSGLAALLASVLAGILWERVGPSAAYFAGGAFAAAALVGLTWFNVRMRGGRTRGTTGRP
jgi:MFS family permease